MRVTATNETARAVGISVVPTAPQECLKARFIMRSTSKKVIGKQLFRQINDLIDAMADDLQFAETTLMGNGLIEAACTISRRREAWLEGAALLTEFAETM
jgi:hypothetical protein